MSNLEIEPVKLSTHTTLTPIILTATKSKVVSRNKIGISSDRKLLVLERDLEHFETHCKPVDYNRAHLDCD